MDRVTGSPAHGAGDPRDQLADRNAGAFVAMPGPVSPRRSDRRRAGVAIAAIATLLLTAALGALTGQLTAATDRRTTPASADRAAPVDPPAARRVLSLAPLGQLMAMGAAPGPRTVVAIPGCHVTLQLGARQPRRVVQCPEVLPQDLGRMLAVTPRQELRFEVPGWQVPSHEAVVQAPDRAGMWTVELPACLSRRGDWLCTTWYATVNVGG